MDDQATQTRKTATQVNQLAESIGALVEAQRQRSRWLNLNSFAAYLIFTVLCGGAFYYLYNSRASSLVGERDRNAAERDAATTRANEATAKLAAREAADAKALDAWQLLEAGKRDDAQKRLAELKTASLSKLDREVLAARAKQAEMMQVDAALKAANAAFKAARYNEVVVTLETALDLQGAAPRMPEMHYLIGLAHLRANEIDKAVTHLQSAVTADVAEEDARFQLASALDRVGQWAKARAEYDRFATAHPQNPSAVFAMRRSATLARMPATAPWVVATPAGAVPAGATPGGATPAGAMPGATPTTPTGPGAAPAGATSAGAMPGATPTTPTGPGATPTTAVPAGATGAGSKPIAGASNVGATSAPFGAKPAPAGQAKPVGPATGQPKPSGPAGGQNGPTTGQPKPSGPASGQSGPATGQSGGQSPASPNAGQSPKPAPSPLEAP